MLKLDIQYACYENRDRDAINTALFEERCKNSSATFGATSDAMVVLSDNLEIEKSSKNYSPFRNRMHFWKNCGEADLTLPRGKGRLDPVLKLYRGGPYMLSTNINVGGGLANGTRAYLQQVVLHPQAQPFSVTLDDGVSIQACFASDVAHVVMKHANQSITPQTFEMKPSSHTFRAKLLKPDELQTKGNTRETVSMKCKQIQLTSTTATTGHKLQGRGVDKLFVHAWSYTSPSTTKMTVIP